MLNKYGFLENEVLFFIDGNAVEAIHLPTSKTAYCDTHNSKHQNKCIAIKELNDFVDKDERWKP